MSDKKAAVIYRRETYHPSLPNIGSILRELQPLLHCPEKCRKAIKDVPFMAFRRPKSLGDYLVHAKLRPSTRLERSSKGTVVCGNRRCQVCKYLEPGERFTSYRTGKSYTINYELDCNSSNVVYLLSCKVCHAQYVGSTTTKFRLRFNNHKARFRAHSRLSFEGRNKDDLLYRHFFGPGTRVKITSSFSGPKNRCVLEKHMKTFTGNFRETFWVRKKRFPGTFEKRTQASS